MSNPKKRIFSCYLIGEIGSLMPQCGELLLQQGHTIHGIVSSNPDSQSWAKQQDIPCIDSDTDLYQFLSANAFDYLFSIANPKILSEQILALPAKGAINYQDSLLPAYAGHYATSWAILNGEVEHGVSWHQMAPKLFAGDLLLQRPVKIDPDDTAASLNMKCFQAAERSFAELLDLLQQEKISLLKQDLSDLEYLYSTLRPGADGLITWNRSAAELDRLVRALNFGAYPNPVGMPKILIQNEVFYVRSLRTLESCSPLSSGQLLAIQDDALVVSTQTFDVVVSELLTGDGADITARDVVAQCGLKPGSSLTCLDREGAGQSELSWQQLAEIEPFWIKRLEALQVYTMPFPAPRKEPLKTAKKITSFTWTVPKKLRRQSGSALLTALGVFVARMLGVERYDVGLNSRDLEHRLGRLKPFVNTLLPFRIEIDEQLSFAAICENITEQVKQQETFHTYAKDLVSRYPQLQEVAFPLCIDLTDGGGSAQPIVDKSLSVTIDENAYKTTWRFETNAFDRQTVKQIFEQFTGLTKSLLTNSNKRLLDIPSVVANSKYQKLLTKWNNTAVDYPKDICLYELIEQQCLKSPEAVAVGFNGIEEITYADFEKKSSVIARYLQQKGFKPNQLIAVCLNRSIDMLVTLFAVQRSGAAYVPFDPDYPEDRLSYMLQNSQATLIITEAALEEKARRIINADKESGDHDEVDILLIDKEWQAIKKTAAKAKQLRKASKSTDLIYVTYTSGSTGQPKGVVVSYQSVINFLFSMKEKLDISTSDRYLAVVPYSFDMSVLDFYLPLIIGASCHICSSEAKRDPDELLQIIQRSRASMMHATPATWKMLFDNGWENHERLKILTGAELVSENFRNNIIQSNSIAWDLYGPTEITVYASVQLIAADQPVCVGKPIANTKLYVVDSAGRLCPVGVPGELWVGGDGVTHGYWQRADLTEQKFADDPFADDPKARLHKTGDLVRWSPEGNIEYLGRLDNQVKVNGFRIELGEIEAVLNHHADIREAVVVVQQKPVERLLAYYISDTGKDDKTLSALFRDYLASKLPTFMVPDFFQRLQVFPLTPNGKVDKKLLSRKRLKASDREQPIEPSNSIEETIAGLWRDALGVEEIGVDDGFFAIGGNSIAAVSLAKKIQQTTGCKFSPATIFKHNTVRSIGEYITSVNPQDNVSVDVREEEPVASIASDATPEYYQDSLAIIGISCHFPGALNHREFWDNLVEGEDSVKHLTEDEINAFGVENSVSENADYVAVDSWLEGKDRFDSEFFGVSEENAVLMDPQFRQLLTHSWKAVEDAGYQCEAIKKTSVFMSASTNFYQALSTELLSQPHIVKQPRDFVSWIFAQGGTIPATISYHLGLQGPSVYLHANCSSSVAGLSAAYQSLQSGEVNYALVGAATLSATHNLGYIHQQGLNFSATGRCKTFAADADGMVDGEGVAVILLKRAVDAVEAGDNIYCLLRGVGLNNDGAERAGFDAPSVLGQSALVQQVLNKTQINPRTISYVEAHGTGTTLGDSIEVMALSEAYENHTSDKQFCGIGSVKTNLGNLDTVAGLAGCIKLAMSLHNRTFPPIINYGEPNPQIDFTDSPFYVADGLDSWSTDEPLRRAALSSFGFGGTNAHAILEEYRQPPTAAPAKQPYLIPLSARQTDDLLAYAKQLLNVLQRDQKGNEIRMDELAFTLQTGRQAMQCRVALLAKTLPDLIAGLKAYIDGKRSNRYIVGKLSTGNGTAKSTADLPDSIVIADWIAEKQYKEIARVWVNGAAVPWELFYTTTGDDDCARPKRISLPTYAFTGKHYWLGTLAATGAQTSVPENKAVINGQSGNGIARRVLNGSAQSRSVRPQHAPVNSEEYAFLKDSQLVFHDKVEKLLLKLIGSLLQADSEQLSIDTKFSTLALESIQIVGFADFWQAVIGKTISPVIFYKLQTIAELKNYLLSKNLVTESDMQNAHTALCTGQLQSSDQPFPLSETQQAFVFGRNYSTAGQLIGSTVYQELVVGHPISLQQLEAAWNCLVSYHQALHTKITPQMQQQLLKDIPYCEIRHYENIDSAEKHLSDIYAEMACQTFELTQWPYFDIRVSLLGDKQAIIHLAMDEVIVDGFSMLLLANQLYQLYTDVEYELPPLSYSQQEYLTQLDALKTDAFNAKTLRYWKHKLNPMPPGPAVLKQPVAGRIESNQVHRLQGRLQKSLWTKMKLAGEKLGCYPTTVLLTLFSGLLQRYTGQDSFSINTTNLNRTALHEDVMKMAGLFINSNIFAYRHQADLSLANQIVSHQQQIDSDANHSLIGAIAVLRELKKAGRIQSDFFLPVVFTSTLSPLFQGLTDAMEWTVQNPMNTTPQVYLDHQVWEEDGDLHYCWYVVDALYQDESLCELFTEYQQLLESAAESTADWGQRKTPAFERGEAFPLSNVQLAYAFGRNVQYQHGGVGSVVYREYDIENLDLEKMSQAWNRVVANHLMLQVSILSSGQQKVLETIQDYSITLEHQADSEADFRIACARIRQKFSKQLFPLDDYPYYALTSCRSVGGLSRLFVCIDLIIADVRSIEVILNQLFDDYFDDVAPPPCSYSFADYMRYKENCRQLVSYAPAADYWKSKFSKLPTGPANIERNCSYHESNILISDVLDCWAVLQQKVDALGVSVNAVLLAVYGEVLLPYNEHEAFSVVVVHWDRELAIHPEVNSVVGDFTRFSWVSFESGISLDERIIQVQQQLDDDYAHRLADGTEQLRKYQSLSFPVVFTAPLQEAVFSEMHPGRLKHMYSLSHAPQVILDLIFTVLSPTELKIQFDTIIDDQGREQQLFREYCQLLENWTLDKVTSSAMPVPESHWEKYSEKCLNQLFEEQAAQHADQCAVKYRDNTLSYRELELATRKCALWLIDRGVASDQVVAIHMERSLEMVVALMSVVRAGAAYLPIDPGFPQKRIQFIVDEANVRYLLVQRKYASLQKEYPGLELIFVEDFLGEEAVDADLAPAVSEDDLAYVIYTSGSTGNPKGCMIEHASVVNRILWQQSEFPIGPGDTVLQKTPYTFDVSVWEFFWPLITGARLLMAEPHRHTDIEYLLDTIQCEQVSVCHFVPSMLRCILQANNLQRMHAMTRVIVSGEALGYDLFKEFDEKIGIPLENLYGPTEAAIDVTYWRAQHNSAEKSYIGKPIHGIQVHILTETLEPVSPGHVGELYLEGIGVGRGYLGQAELTKKAFIPSPFDSASRLYKTGDLASLEQGNVFYHGRVDSQVKFNGLRIELEEIEQHLRKHPAIDDALVRVEQLHQQDVLAAYLVSDDTSVVNRGPELRSFLQEFVPKYMTPHVWKAIDEIPLTAHGKRDRKNVVAKSVVPESAPLEPTPLNEMDAPPLANVDAQLAEMLQELL